MSLKDIQTTIQELRKSFPKFEARIERMETQIGEIHTMTADIHAAIYRKGEGPETAQEFAARHAIGEARKHQDDAPPTSARKKQP